MCNRSNVEVYCHIKRQAFFDNEEKKFSHANQALGLLTYIMLYKLYQNNVKAKSITYWMKGEGLIFTLHVLQDCMNNVLVMNLDFSIDFVAIMSGYRYERMFTVIGSN